MREIDRLNMDASTEADVMQYYQTRALQLAFCDYTWTRKLTPVPGGYSTQFHKGGQVFYSFYILAENRGKGFGKQALDLIPGRIVTIKDCGVEDFVRSHNHGCVVETGIFDTPEYQMINKYYGTRSPKRAPVFLMNHIDEGLLILKGLNATPNAMRAFCLHPLLQDDDELTCHLQEVVANADPGALVLAMEYRSVANAYLSQRTINSIEEIALSPLYHVNLMLKADKIQNRKDFTLYHKATHRRSAELEQYFQNWLERLNVTDYDQWVERLTAINPKVTR